MRLIDANKFIERCKQIIHEESDNPACISWAFAYDNMIDEINEQPTVDAVEVVRCKDCKYCNYYSISDDFTCRYWDWPTKENGYCHIGEKSEYTAREWEAKYNNYYDKVAFIKGVKDEQTL